MCGICGQFDPAGADPATIDSMMSTLVHRGPDDEGSCLIGPIGLGSRRLSIIDLAEGRQPIANEDETIWIVFNGEIYNYPDLRRELLERARQRAALEGRELLEWVKIGANREDGAARLGDR